MTTSIQELLDLRVAPVAVRFFDTPPDGVERIDEPAVAGCSYWKVAADGKIFYTESSDHYGCSIGSFTHGVELPPEKADELQQLVGTMVQLEYLKADEVPSIPRRDTPPKVIAYAPLDQAPFEPDVVLVSGTAKQMMLLGEAAHLAQIQCDTSLVGRPTCAAIPAVMQSEGTVSNLGCIGNRVYTEMPDDELYFVIAGKHMDQLTERLATIVNANEQLEAFHRGRLEAFHRGRMA